MDRGYESLTIQDAFILSKIMANVKTAKRLMELLTGQKIYKIQYDKNNIVECVAGTKGISVELHMADAKQSVWKTELYLVARDIFKEGRAVYHFRERCDGVTRLELPGGIHRIFVCATKESTEIVKDEGLKAFLNYMLNPEERGSNLVKMLDDEVKRIKANRTYEKEYRQMRYEETEANQRDFARQMQEYDNR
ncbi:MAG: hypothetical protein J6M02_04445 [Clostridia bacterium]|nr:hypothetical protein [Clostridia bacterium]